MKTMCHVCEQKKSCCGYYCRNCSHPDCLELKKEVFSSISDENFLTWSLNYLVKNSGGEFSRPDALTPYLASQNSPALALSSFKSCISSSGDFPADMSTVIREDGNGALGTSQEQPNLHLTAQPEDLRSGNLSKNINIQSVNAQSGMDETIEATLSGEVYASISVAAERDEDSNDDKVGHTNSTLEDVRSVRDGDDSDGAENVIDSSTVSFLATIETDPLIWLPPAPVDVEDDMDSVAYNDDDDDDYSDGTKWGKPNYLNGLDIEPGISDSFKDEREKAMVDAMNGQFKILVSRFLASENISFSDGEDSNSWLDIIASLSWQAALLVKPDANEGRAMDPGSYVKVKCIATGSCSESQLIKGLVFKKNTAHKHMPTKCRNPRLLLLPGALGHREVGLSSFDAMEQEKDYLKSINEMIETCQPNVVLVEKSVSRDIQESLLAKGMTLVFDMKLTRLKRVARCVGSQIGSFSDILVNPRVKQCDSFHIEKFVEEHNGSSEGGKRSSKTLLFLEGFPKPLGCTILLKGAHIDELKKVKRVVQYTVFAAYHLILETSFFADQRAFFSDTNAVRGGNGFLNDETGPITSYGAEPDFNTTKHEGAKADTSESHTSDIPVSNEYLENSADEAVHSNSDPSLRESSQWPSCSPSINESENNQTQGDLFWNIPDGNVDVQSDSLALPDLPWHFMSSFSTTFKKFLADSFAPVSNVSNSLNSGFDEEDVGIQNMGPLPVSPSLETPDHEMKENDRYAQGNLGGEVPNEGKQPLSSSNESTDICNADVSSRMEVENNDNFESMLNPQSILVLLSSQCIAKGTVCEQSHLSRIKYYGNFDVSLGRFLQEILLSKKHSCSSCGEPPEAHVYCYTHQNGNLTVLVRRLPPESSLSGEAERKIWMWTRCLKCDRESGIPRSTQRVVMSTAARNLSFGKFLELSFSSHSAASRLSSKCGHSLHRDCLRFFGLGSKVAMFRYSPVEIYAACKPPPMLEFYSLNGQEWLKRQAKSVLQKGDLLFSEVANLLQKLDPRNSSILPKQPANFSAPVKGIREAEDMLIQEKSEFEASLLKAINYNVQLGKAGNEILGLSWLNQELLLALYIWDCRLHSLMQSSKDTDASHDELHGEHYVQDSKYVAGNGATTLENPTHNPMEIEASSSSCNKHACNQSLLEVGLEMESAETSGHISKRFHSSLDAGIVELHHSENKIPGSLPEQTSSSDQDSSIGVSGPSSTSLKNKEYQEGRIRSFQHACVDNPDTTAQSELTELLTELEIKSDRTTNGGKIFTDFISKDQNSSNSVTQDIYNSKPEDSDDWIWAAPSELRKAHRRDLHGGSLQKFKFIRSYTPTYLSPMHELVAQERDSLHFPVGQDGSVLSIHEDEISSIIACALALSEDQNSFLENIDEDSMEGKVEIDKTIENSHSLTSEGSVASSHWSSAGSLESESIRSSRSVSSLSSDELSTSGSEGSSYVDRQIASDSVHPEIPVGVGKAAAKSKYSVVCIHAKQFYDLRRMCCPSELAYISSLSRCKKWDAQGGKSKAFFAKTMDDRLIIKQVKKTEVESFLKFASDYFSHISHSLSSGSQTCLAKILGIYQVRQNRNGKEVKTDLMVMENLLFGRNVTRTYDLKGAVFSRYISDSNDSEKVRLDQNFIEDMRLSPMYIGGRNKLLLQRAIWNDTSFLTSINVMDYSLLVGVDKQQCEIVFGIIDYMRQYTWDKQLETWVKSSLVVPKNSLPTVISPKEYKKRFRKFMSKYFLAVPDTWSSSRCSGPCKFCTDGVGNLTESHSLKLQNSQVT